MASFSDRLTPDSTAFRAGAALFGALVLHLAFGLLYHPGQGAPSDRESRTPHHPPLAYLGHPDDPGLSTMEREMYDWAAIASPSRMLYPDYEAGFSHFGNPAIPHDKPQITPYLPEIAPQPLPTPSQTSVPVNPTPLDEVIYSEWNKTTPSEQLALDVAPPASGVYWRFANGRQILNPPEVTEAQLQEAMRQSKGAGHFTDEAVTLVEIIQEGIIPRLVLRKSCGLPAFDRLAIRALCETLREPSRSPASSSGHPQNYMIQAIWNLEMPDTEGETP